MDYIHTFSKVKFTPANPQEEDILIEDIAHSLAMQTRAGGHFPAFHSVAQHCLECSDEAAARHMGPRVELGCLLHDASEAYISDITTPVKKGLPQYQELEDRLLESIFHKYLGGLSENERKAVFHMDKVLLYYEFYHFMGVEITPKPFLYSNPDFSEKDWRDVEQTYLDRFYELYGRLLFFKKKMNTFDHGVSVGKVIPGRKISGVLFDIDGVILDTEKLYTRFWQEAAYYYGFGMTREQALQLRSLKHDHAEALFLEWFGPDADYYKIRERRILIMNTYISRTGVDRKPGVRGILTYLKRKGIPYCAASNSPKDRVIRNMQYAGLGEMFSEDQIVGADMVKAAKPDPDIYLTAAKKLGLPPEECLAVEDSHSGLIAARRAGCMPVLVPDLEGPSAEDLKQIYALAERIDYLEVLIELQNRLKDQSSKTQEA